MSRATLGFSVRTTVAMNLCYESTSSDAMIDR